MVSTNAKINKNVPFFLGRGGEIGQKNEKSPFSHFSGRFPHSARKKKQGIN